ncbi:MAG: 2-oxoglutarate dehydrogenase complex dihydrolipoyllysine-residue succinyltransferase [Bacteroidales bacterium]|nr:2-oxoglutarate dehydrogenase complex dihydrolipoyllysine-residue succinyltransferase [Bacteroidales bacterium]
MTTEIKVPSPGESISEVLLSNWLVQDGAYVEKDQEIAEIDSDKATLTIVSEVSGIISLKVAQGETIEVGRVVATVEATEAPPEVKPKEAPAAQEKSPEKPLEKPAAPVTTQAEIKPVQDENLRLNMSPLARKMSSDAGLTDQEIIDFLQHYRLSKKDVSFILEEKQKSAGNWMTMQSILTKTSNSLSRGEQRSKMSPLRRKLSERLISVKNETAMLTTFNEVNMTPIMNLRNTYKEAFKAKHQVGLGFMSFFTKAVTEALKLYPQVNSQINGDEIVSFDYCDISIAVSGPKGLVVPVIRNAEVLSLAEIELKVKELATKARENKLSLDEMAGGTFTITNGGVFGSMLSTPIINPPQSAILGMHNVVERPIAVNGKVEIHPIMYVALSYDHRIIDGRESVGFLVKVKEMLENPTRMLFGSKNPDEILLGL